MLIPAVIMPGLGLPELIIILAIILIIFGPKKLPDLGKALGSTIKELRKSSQKDEDEGDDAKVEASTEEAKKEETKTSS